MFVKALAGSVVVPFLFSGRRSRMTRLNGGIPTESLGLHEMDRNAPHSSPLPGAGSHGLNFEVLEDEFDWESNWIDLGGEG
jgi:hypothetical protein